MGFELFAALDFDWRLAVSSRAAQAALRRWRGDPVLGRLRDLDEILERTARGADRRDANAVLTALLRQAKTDEMAARAALQALAPGLTNVAKRMGAARDPDIAAEVVAVALTKIKSYPYERRARAVAANLVLDVLNALWHSHGPQDGRPRERCVAPDHLARVPDPQPDAATARPTGRDVLEAVADSGRLPAEQLTLIADAVLDRVPVPMAAARAGISEKAMWRRRDRARASVVRAYRLARSA
ncbi:MAG: hypothetical protein ACRDZ1_10805 [Acidimicrobiia bacterium]